MVKRTNKKFYHNLSRKELQRLCKKYGLPANKSHSYLANSLVSFFENDFESAPSRKRFSPFKEPSLPLSVLQLPSQKILNSAVKSKRDGTCGIVYRSGHKDSEGAFSEIVKKCNAQNGIEENDCINGFICNLKETSLSGLQCGENDVNHSFFQRKSSLLPSDDMPLFGNGPIEKGTFFSGNASIVSSKTHVKAPSFQFHVSSEAGITLHVDLNSSTLDWTKRFHREVFVCENIHKNKCYILAEDLGFLTKGSEEMENSSINDHKDIISCLSSEIVSGDHVGPKQSDKIDGAFMFSKITSRSLTCVPSEPIEEDQTLDSTETRRGAHKLNLSNSESSAKNNKYAILGLDSDDIFHRKPNRVIAVPRCPSIPSKLKHQNSIIGIESFDFPSLQNNSNSVFDLFVGSREFIENSSVKMQLSEVSSFHIDESWSPCETGGTLDLVNFEHGGGRQESRFNNSKDTIDASKCHLHTSTEEREKKHVLSKIKISEHVQLSNSMEKTCLGDENLEPKKEHEKRKQVNDIRQNHYLKSHTRILRSAKHIVNSPRRSDRLITKFGEMTKRRRVEKTLPPPVTNLVSESRTNVIRFSHWVSPVSSRNESFQLNLCSIKLIGGQQFMNLHHLFPYFLIFGYQLPARA